MSCISLISVFIPIAFSFHMQYHKPFLEFVVIIKHIVSSLLMIVCLKCVSTLHKSYLSWMLKRMFRFSMLEQSYFSITLLFSFAKPQFSFLKLNLRDVTCSQPIADFNVFAMCSYSSRSFLIECWKGFRFSKRIEK